MLNYSMKREFETSLSREEVLARISEKLPERFLDRSSELFGKVGTDFFKVRRNINRNSVFPFYKRNNANPVAVGRVSEAGEGSLVKILLRMPIIGIAFMSVARLMILFGFLSVLLAGIVDDPFVLIGVPFCAFMALAVELLIYLCFVRPARKLADRLEEILKV